MRVIPRARNDPRPEMRPRATITLAAPVHGESRITNQSHESGGILSREEKTLTPALSQRERESLLPSKTQRAEEHCCACSVEESFSVEKSCRALEAFCSEDSGA